MNPTIEVVILFLAVLLLSFAGATQRALEILSYIHHEKKSNEKWWDTGYVRLLLEKPLVSAVFLRMTQGVGALFGLASAFDLGTEHVFAGLQPPPRMILTTLFALAVVFLPPAGFSLAAFRHAQKILDVSKFFMYPLLLVSFPLISPIERILRALGSGFTDAVSFPLKPLEQKIAMFGNENGSLEEEEQKLMSSIFDFGDTQVREVMVPRIDIVAVDVNTGREEAMAVIIDSGHSRIPVYDETIDKVVGIVYTKDLLRKTIAGQEFTLDQVMREVFFVPESKKIDELLSEFKKRKKHIAIAVDEYGGTAGLVTMEDILEEIVGDIQDEFDSEEELIERIDEDTAVCNAKIHVDDLKESLGIDLSEGGSDSLGGFLYEKIGRVPRVGDKVEDDDVTYEIRSVVRQRIDKVLIKGLRLCGKKAERGSEE